MNSQARRFLQELENALLENPHREEILEEYKMHIQDMLAEEKISEEATYAILVERIGEPKDLAAIWKEENAVTPDKMQRLFIILNSCLFIGGALFALAYNKLDWTIVEIVWEALTESATIIVLVYMFFWGLLGYEIGKAFGARGKKILTRTFLICIIPNTLVMYLIIFRFIPYEWFGTLLDEAFIVLAFIVTAALFPVSWLGYIWGKRDSLE